MKVLRYLLGLAFGTAGVLHFTNERSFRNIVQNTYHYVKQLFW